ncbi:alpha/beta hydrolase [Antribacter sp. KLBMP9083]|uniref:Alpha/beta hydrolase n=1 Tax=Antribacter soli TaxID=2910976 RepID=A0AA41QE98_9MICO|nr:alpha/beta hydrolase [Antribacter soli]MCF4121541.1 alpha/beta hydrolase [Antribacter soli]
MIFRTAATSAALAVVLAVVGAVAGPQWEPEPVTDHLRPVTSSTRIGGVTGATVHAVGSFEVRETEMTVALDGTEVGAILREPVDGPDEAPGMVFIHGAGTGKATVAFTAAATELASAGVVTLVPDKRLDTYSTRHRDYVAMAGDYLHSVDLLRGVPGVDPDLVGVYSESEGAWISPIMMVEDRRLAFQVLVSAPVVPPRQQAAFAVDNYLRNTDVPAGVFRAIPRAVGMTFPGGGFEYADFDVRPWLERQEAPILMTYGTGDASMPLVQATHQVLADTAGSDGAPVTVRFYEGANHGMHVNGELVPDFPRDVATWIQGLPGTAGALPQVAGATPNQLYLAAPVPQPQWYGNGDIVLGVVVGAVGLLVLALVVLAGVAVRSTAVRRRTGHPGAILAPGLRGPLTVTGAGAVLTTVALGAYLVAVARLAMDYEKDAVVVQGGWIGVRLLGLVTVVGAALVLNRARELHGRVAARPPEGGRVAAVVAAFGFWAVCVASTALLVTLAYWGVYQLGI